MKRQPPMTSQQVIERLDERVYKDPNSGCWLWLGFTQFGYARCGFAGFPGFTRTHRLSFFLHRGEIPKGLVLDHLCRVRECINPWHLEPVSLAENVRRGIRPYERTRNGRKTHCRNGHPFDEQNTYIGFNWRGRMLRECRICKAAKQNFLRLARKGSAQCV